MGKCMGRENCIGPTAVFTEEVSGKTNSTALVPLSLLAPMGRLTKAVGRMAR